MRLSNKSLANLNKALAKQAAPGPAPRPGLEWKPQTHRWIRPTGSNEVTEDEVRDYADHPSFDYLLGEGKDRDPGRLSDESYNIGDDSHTEDAARYIISLRDQHERLLNDPGWGGEEGTEVPEQHPEDHPLHAKLKAHEETNRDGWTKAMGAINFSEDKNPKRNHLGNRISDEFVHDPKDKAEDLITDKGSGAYDTDYANKLMNTMTHIWATTRDLSDEEHPLERHAGKDKDIHNMAEELGGIDPVAIASWVNANPMLQGEGGHFGHDNTMRDSVRDSMPL